MTVHRNPSKQKDASSRTLELESNKVAGRWWLEIGSATAGRSVLLAPGQAVDLGSSPCADVEVDDRTVSARHCQVKREPHGIVVRDLGSTNGLYVGGARVAEAVLSVPDTAFVIGRTSVVARQSPPGESMSNARGIPGLVGNSSCMRRVAKEVWQVAGLRVPVLIQGESGTGKDVVARALHELGAQRGPYVPINAAAFTEALVDSELFGHCRGAFTGAVVNRAGAFEQADGGTLFLDEVAELPPGVQVRLLRVVEDGRVRPLGGTREARVLVRVVSASWANLPERVAQGRFRADLYHRLSTITIELPPLRERKSDIPALCQALLGRFESELGPKHITPTALARLVDYGWPGNVRELSGVLYRAGLRAAGASIEPQHLSMGQALKKRRAVTMLSPLEARELHVRHGGNTSAAARAASVPRSTFRGWLERNTPA